MAFRVSASIDTARVPRSRVFDQETAAKLQGALLRYARAEFGQTTLRSPPEENLEVFQRNLNIRERGLGPRTVAALRRYDRRFDVQPTAPRARPVAPTVSRDRLETAPAAERVLRTPRAPTPEARPPAPAVQQVIDQGGFFDRMAFRANSSSGRYGGTAEQAYAELLRQTNGRFQRNHVYVVQLDRENTTRDFQELKGTTYVFTTSSLGNVSLRGQFQSSSQPMTNAPVSGMNGPYIPSGVYSMGTTAVGNYGGLHIDAYQAWRDTNQNGQIDRHERRAGLSSTNLIRWHSAAYGSAGCSVIYGPHWQRFFNLVNSHGANGATYILNRRPASATREA